MNLKKHLGQFDAILEVNELALREFISNIGPNKSDEYIKGMSAKHKVKVDGVDIIKLQSRISQLYILSVFQQFEEFLEALWEEHPNHKTWRKDKNLTLIENILGNLNQFGALKKQLGSMS